MLDVGPQEDTLKHVINEFKERKCYLCVGYSEGQQDKHASVWMRRRQKHTKSGSKGQDISADSHTHIFTLTEPLQLFRLGDMAKNIITIFISISYNIDIYSFRIHGKGNVFHIFAKPCE